MGIQSSWARDKIQAIDETYCDTWSLTDCAKPGIEHATQSSRDAANTVGPQWEFHLSPGLWDFFFCLFGWFFFFFFFFLLFRVAPKAHGGSQARGWIGATASLYHSHSNTGSLTHWARPGMEPTTSWFLTRFVSTAPQHGNSGLWDFWSMLNILASYQLLSAWHLGLLIKSWGA